MDRLDRRLEAGLVVDWTRDGRLSLTKAALDCLAGEQDRGIDVYAKYVNECTLIDTDLSFSGLSRLGSINRNLMASLQYRADDPAAETAHWSFYSGQDLVKISELLDVGIAVFLWESGELPAVISRPRLLSRLAVPGRRLYPWHDTRDVHMPSHADDVDADANLVVMVVAVHPPGRQRRLFQLLPSDYDLCLRKATIWFAQTPGPTDTSCLHVDDFGGDYLSLVDAVLGLPPRPTTNPMFSLFDFYECDRSVLFRRWSEAGSCVAIVSYKHKKGRSFHPRQWSNPNHVRYACLAIASNMSPTDCTVDFADHASPDARVVCFVGGKYACLLAEPHRQQAIAQHLDTRGLKQTLRNRGDLSGVPKVLSPEAVAAAAAAHKAKKDEKKKSRKRYMRRVCRCRTCRQDAKKYANNMAEWGPERLCSVPYSMADLLQMLGAYDDRAQQLIRRLVRLSVAAMDIESQTIEVDLTGPRPGPRVRYPQFGGATLEGHVIKTQRPLMIGHSDELLRRGETEGGWWHDTVTDDSPAAVYNLMARYWCRVTQLRRDAAAEKTAIAQDLLDLVGLYRQAYDAYTSLWIEMSVDDRRSQHNMELASLQADLLEGAIDEAGYNALADLADTTYFQSDEWAMPEESATAAAFRCTVPGLLEARVRALIRRYVVFSFYG